MEALLYSHIFPAFFLDSIHNTELLTIHCWQPIRWMDFSKKKCQRPLEVASVVTKPLCETGVSLYSSPWPWEVSSFLNNPYYRWLYVYIYINYTVYISLSSPFCPILSPWIGLNTSLLCLDKPPWPTWKYRKEWDSHRDQFLVVVRCVPSRALTPARRNKGNGNCNLGFWVAQKNSILSMHHEDHSWKTLSHNDCPQMKFMQS